MRGGATDARPPNPYAWGLLMGPHGQAKGLPAGPETHERPHILDLQGPCEVREHPAQASQGLIQGRVGTRPRVVGMVAQHSKKWFHGSLPHDDAIITRRGLRFRDPARVFFVILQGMEARHPLRPNPEPSALLALGRRVLDLEADTLAALAAGLDTSFADACRLLFDCAGRVVVVGMGKSGHIGGKIAATLASTGTPAFFVHPGEASHGDLGMITPEDVVLAISHSGETAEILTILPIIKRMGVRLLALTGAPTSSLARQSDVHLLVAVAKEACPLDLAPTASTTAALAMGDALAIALYETRGFTPEDFARSHPGGRLGRRLLVYIADIMHKGEQVPQVSVGASLPDALVEMSSKGLGMTAVVDDAGRLCGIFTDGDLRRALNRGVDVYKARISDVMTRHPKTAQADHLAAEVVAVLRAHNISGLFVVDEAQRVVGALNMNDLLRAGVV